MPKGLPKWAINQALKAKAENVFAYAWKLIKKRGRKQPKRLKSRKSTTKRRGTQMARKRQRSRRSFFNTGTIFKWLRIASLVAPGASVALDRSLSNDTKIDTIIARYTGYSMKDKRFNWAWLAAGWTPYIMTNLVTIGIRKMNGIIRRF